MKLVIFGANGPTGVELCCQALALGRCITAAVAARVSQNIVSTRTSLSGTSRPVTISLLPCSQSSAQTGHMHQRVAPPRVDMLQRRRREPLCPSRKVTRWHKINQAPLFVRVSNRLTLTLLRAGVKLFGPGRYPMYLLTVRGRKSGQPRTVPIVIWEHQGKR
jgi:hypothetical protein